MGGLTLESLEGGDNDRPRQSRTKSRRNIRDDMSEEEEEMYGRRGGPQDQYDLGDDFIVDSDDEEEEEDEDAEGEDDLDEMIEQPSRSTHAARHFYASVETRDYRHHHHPRHHQRRAADAWDSHGEQRE